MRIGIIGKGGSGKTSFTWMMAQALAHQGCKVCLLDADYNQHLAAMFGIQNERIQPLHEAKSALVAHAIGQRVDVTFANFPKDTQPNNLSGSFDLFGTGTLPAGCLVAADPQISIARVGEYRNEDQGEHCYHYHTGAVDILLNHHVPLTSDQYILVDYTAGIDPAVSRLSQIVDTLLLVVEPTMKGVQVVRQWQTLLAGQGIRLFVIGNKLTGPDDARWLAEAILPTPCSALLGYEPALPAIERGRLQNWDQLRPDNRKQLLQLADQFATDGYVRAACPGPSYA